MAHYRAVGDVPPKRHTQHRDPDGQPLPRGADGRGGVLLRLLAALPPRRAVGDRRQRGLGAARPDPDPQPPAQAAAPQAARARDGQGPGHRPPAGARQQRRPDRRTSSPASTPRRTTATRSATSASTSRPAPAPSRPCFGVLSYRTGDYVIVPAGDHAPLGAGRAEPALRDRGEQPHRAAEALPVPLRAAARARAVLRARPARPDRAVPGRGRRTSRCWSSTAPAPASSAPG